MPEPAILRALDTAAKEVLERMFFQETAGVADPAARAGADAIAVRLAFEGDPPGWLGLRVGPALARSLAADFLGVDETEVSSGQVESVMCELANMICGSLLSQLEKDATFRLGSPASESPDLLDQEAGQAINHTVEATGGVLTVILKTESPICPASEKSAS